MSHQSQNAPQELGRKRSKRSGEDREPTTPAQRLVEPVATLFNKTLPVQLPKLAQKASIGLNAMFFKENDKKESSESAHIPDEVAMDNVSDIFTLFDSDDDLIDHDGDDGDVNIIPFQSLPAVSVFQPIPEPDLLPVPMDMRKTGLRRFGSTLGAHSPMNRHASLELPLSMSNSSHGDEDRMVKRRSSKRRSTFGETPTRRLKTVDSSSIERTLSGNELDGARMVRKSSSIELPAGKARRSSSRIERVSSNKDLSPATVKRTSSRVRRASSNIDVAPLSVESRPSRRMDRVSSRIKLSPTSIEHASCERIGGPILD